MNKTLVKYQSQLTTFSVGFMVGYTQHYYISHSLHAVCTLGAVAAAAWGVKAILNSRQNSAPVSLAAVHAEHVEESQTIDLTQSVNA